MLTFIDLVADWIKTDQDILACFDILKSDFIDFRDQTYNLDQWVILL
jgi:hypothetical protein